MNKYNWLQIVHKAGKFGIPIDGLPGVHFEVAHNDGYGLPAYGLTISVVGTVVYDSSQDGMVLLGGPWITDIENYLIGLQVQIDYRKQQMREEDELKHQQETMAKEQIKIQQIINLTREYNAVRY